MHEASLESLRPGRPACETGVLLQENRQGRWGEGGHAKEQLNVRGAEKRARLGESLWGRAGGEAWWVGVC